MKTRFDENCLVYEVDRFCFVFVLRCNNDVAVFFPYAALFGGFLFCFLT